MSEIHINNQSLLDQMSSEVAPHISPFMKVLVTHSCRITACVILVLVAAVGYGIYSHLSTKNINDAQKKLGGILVIADGQDRLAKLNNFLASAPEPIKGSVLLSIVTTASEVKNYAAALDAWEKLARDPKDAFYVTAMIGKAENLAMLDKAEEALGVLESMTLAQGSASANMVNSMIADLAEKNGQIDKAIAACNKLATETAPTNQEEADFWRQKAISLERKK
ncbi:hypothetical protein FACS1894206_03400 [Deltaproteobacteria bacterium]|nr:hypothetical protein FACS1894206_03400 [Deltaproteobacteria bacterium]